MKIESNAYKYAQAQVNKAGREWSDGCEASISQPTINVINHALSIANELQKLESMKRYKKPGEKNIFNNSYVRTGYNKAIDDIIKIREGNYDE